VKKSKKIIIILLILVLLSLLLISCGKDTNTTAPEQQNNTENKDSLNGENQNPEENQIQSNNKPVLDLPDVKYDGYNFKVMNVAQSAMTWVYTTICVDEETGEGINDAVYKRNRTVEERFNIEIKEIIETSEDAVNQKASKSIKSGSDDYDLFMLTTYTSVILAKNHMLMDYNEIPYVDLAQSWWDKDMVRDLSVGGRNYLVTGDFSMTHYGDTIGMFFNKKLLNEMGLESPYNIINEGKWTYDKFSEMAKDASRDLNGDGKFDKNDQFGYMSLTHIWAQGFIASAGQQMVGKDSDDMHTFVMKNERFVEIYKKMIEIIHQDNMTFDADTAGNHRLQDIMFPNNQALFWSEVVHWATILRDMNADFGIIIHPKWDENQSGYHNYVFPPPVMCVPITSPDLNRTGMILEALCYESTDTVIKAYYDVLLKTKISRDNESEKMLDIMFRNRWYNLANTFYSNEIYNPFNTLSKKKDADIVSWIEKNEGKIITAIEKTNAAFLEN